MYDDYEDKTDDVVSYGIYQQTLKEMKAKLEKYAKLHGGSVHDKECLDIEAYNSTFQQKYILWYGKNILVEDCAWTSELD